MERTDRKKVDKALILCLAAVCVLTGYILFRYFSGAGEVTLLNAGNLEEGDIVTFGVFEQDGNSENGPEALPWIVLETAQDRALLLSRDVLMPIPFNYEYEETVWEDCSLREWLNGSFIDETFSDEEKGRILKVENENPDNPGMDSHGCGVTEDSVFLLRMEEYSAYMRTEEDRFVTGSADPTRYALILHLEVDDENEENPGKTCWWLRTSGSDQYAAVFVDRDGTIHAPGAQVNHDTYCGLRPAVWVSI